MRDIFGRRRRGSERLSESRALPGHTDPAREETPYTAVRPKNEGLAASTLPEIGEKNSFGAPKRRRNATFWPPACDKAWPDRGARGRIKSGAKFWKIKSIVSQYVPAQAACYRALAAEKNRYAEEGVEHRETAKRIFGRVKSSGWAAAFFRTTPVFILCAERFRDARGALFERAHYTAADHLFCRCC